jgi:hypothetical protein
LDNDIGEANDGGRYSSCGYDVFRYRLIMSEHTRINGFRYDEIIDIILQKVSLPK